jgi:predicted Fe-Mo cluster-binding NifX family protein
VSEVIIAIATDGNSVAGHFGRCPSYTLVTVENGKEVDRKTIDNPGHQPGFLPQYLHELGARCIVAGGMGLRAQMLFDEHGIETVVGVAGLIDEVVHSYLKGRLAGGESTCDHGPDHACEH